LNLLQVAFALILYFLSTLIILFDPSSLVVVPAPSPVTADVVLSTPGVNPVVAGTAAVAAAPPHPPEIVTYATTAPIIITAALQGIIIPHISPVDKPLLLLIVLIKLYFLYQKWYQLQLGI
jgi:hypothetical protein